MDDLLLGETVLAELSHKDLNFLGGAAIQVREISENLSDLIRCDFMVHLEKFFDFFNLDWKVGAEYSRHIEDHFESVFLLDAFSLLQVVKSVLETSFALAENGGVLEHQSAHELLAEPKVVDKHTCHGFHAFVVLLVVQQKVGLLTSDVPLFLSCEAVRLVEVLASLTELSCAHLKENLRESDLLVDIEMFP